MGQAINSNLCLDNNINNNNNIDNDNNSNNTNLMKIIKYARYIELFLYYNATTFGEYMDPSTLPQRVFLVIYYRKVRKNIKSRRICDETTICGLLEKFDSI